MKKNRISKMIYIAYSIFMIVLFVSCSDNKEVISPENSIDINCGAFINNEGIETYNFISGDTASKIDTSNKIINNFNKASNTYTFFKDGRYYINYNSQDIKINHDKVFNLKVSPNGQYVFYFINDGYLKPMVLNLKENIEIEINNKAIISGQFIDWFDGEKLAYYGIDNESKVGGIFIYNILTGEESLIYKVNGGYIQFLKYIKNGVAFVQEHFGDSASLKIINFNNEVIEVCDDILEISDIQVIGENIFVLGRMKNNSYSIYEVKDGKVNRIVYDFPKNIHVERGLSVNENGELLFMGSFDDKDTDNIYKYSDDSISLIFESKSKCNFINVN